MKKYLILFLILAFTSLSLDARIITVSNNPAIPAQYTNLQEAIDNADVGDTIFVHQSSTNYGNIVVNKKITLLGQGRNTILSSIFLSSVEGNQANNTSGTVVSGFYFVTNNSQNCAFGQDQNDNTSINNILIQRCHFNQKFMSKIKTNNYGTNSNWVIKDCIFSPSAHIYLGSYIYPSVNTQSNNFVFMNNIINSYIYYSSANHYFINNVFTGNYSQGFSYISNIIVENNIFFRWTPRGCENSIFNNNLTYNTSNNDIPYGNNVGSNNIINQNPKFVNAVGYDFNLNENFNLQESSPALNAGNDGKDLGIYGGSEPFPSNYSLYPTLPYVTNLNIPNKNINYNGSIIINFDAMQNK